MIRGSFGRRGSRGIGIAAAPGAVDAAGGAAPAAGGVTDAVGAVGAGGARGTGAGAGAALFPWAWPEAPLVPCFFPFLRLLKISW